MPGIEERLRTALDTLADEVAPARDPRAELERRLDRRDRAARRGAVFTAVAAAGVVLAVIVPVVADPDAPGGTANSGRPAGLEGARLPELGTVARGGETLRAVGYLRGEQYCTMVVAPGEPAGRPACEPVPTWPEGPGSSLVQSRELLNGDPADDTGMLANRLVFLTDPVVATLTVRRGNGTAVEVTEFDRNEHAAAFLADFAGPNYGFGYTARDIAGTIVEDAIS